MNRLFFKPQSASESPGGLCKIARSHLKTFSVGLADDPRICISTKFPGEIDAAGLGTTLWTATLKDLKNTLSWQLSIIRSTFFVFTQCEVHTHTLKFKKGS